MNALYTKTPQEVPPTSSGQSKKYLGIAVIAVLLVGVGLTVFISQQSQDLRQRASETPTPMTIAGEPSKDVPFPVQKGILTSPMLTDWSAQLKGTVVAKTDFLLTLSTQGNKRVTMLINPGNITIKKVQVKNPEQAITAEYKTLTLGNSVSVVARATQIKKQWHFVAETILIQDDVVSTLSTTPPTQTASDDISDLLTNPLIDVLYANTQGVVIKKTETTLTIEKENRQLTLFVEESQNITTFTPQTTKQELNPANEYFKDIAIGDTLKGGVSILVAQSSTLGTLTKRAPGDILAHYMTIIKK